MKQAIVMEFESPDALKKYDGKRRAEMVVRKIPRLPRRKPHPRRNELSGVSRQACALNPEAQAGSY